MTKRPADDFRYQKYLKELIEDFDMTDKERAESVGVSERTILNWKKSVVDWDYVLTERRKRYKRLTPLVDQAVFKKACKGDTKAADLFYQRFDGWVPKSEQQSSGTMEISGEALAKLIADLKAEEGKDAETQTPIPPESIGGFGEVQATA